MKYHLPFSGDPQVLGCAPNPRVPNSYPVTVEGAEVCFEIIDFSGNAESIKREAEQVLGLIRQQSANLEKTSRYITASSVSIPKPFSMPERHKP